MMVYWVSALICLKVKFKLTIILIGSSEILGRAIVGNSSEVRFDEKMFYEDMFRLKSATAQWVPLQEVINQQPLSQE